MPIFDDLSNLEVVQQALPLEITYANMNPDPVLVLSGPPSWGSNFMCDWYLEGPGVTIDRFEDSEEDSDDALLTGEDLSFLIGESIIGVHSNPELINPVISISGGYTLTVRATSPIDPWMIRVPGMTMVGQMPPETP